MSDLDDELEAEVGRIMTRGEERRRAVAVDQIHQSTPLGLVFRLAGVTLAITTALLVYYLLGATLAIRSAGDFCRALGICG